jgi:hypothetical protein
MGHPSPPSHACRARAATDASSWVPQCCHQCASNIQLRLCVHATRLYDDPAGGDTRRLWSKWLHVGHLCPQESKRAQAMVPLLSGSSSQPVRGGPTPSLEAARCTAVHRLSAASGHGMHMYACMQSHWMVAAVPLDGGRSQHQPMAAVAAQCQVESGAVRELPTAGNSKKGGGRAGCSSEGNSEKERCPRHKSAAAAATASLL